MNIFCSNFVVPCLFDSNQIVSLSLDYSHIEMIDISSFVRLRSLSLMYIKDEQLQKLSQLSLNNLRQISIQSKCARFVTKIVSIYFPHVNRMVLNSMKREFVVKTFPHDQTKNAIEKLTLDGRIKLAKLFRLWSFVRNNINKKEMKMIFQYLRFLNFVLFLLSMAEFINVIIGLMKILFLIIIFLLTYHSFI